MFTLCLMVACFLILIKINVWPSLCAFSWVSSTLMNVPDAPVSSVTDFFALSIMWGWMAVLGHLYNISRIEFPSSLWSCYPSTVFGDISHGVSYFFFPCGHYYSWCILHYFFIQKCVSTHPEISCLIQFLFIVVSFSCLFSLFLPISTV